MTIQIDWAGTGSTPGGVPYEIYVEKVDLTLVQAGPPQIYELDVDAFRLTLRDLEDDPDGRPWPKTHNHDTQTVLGGVTYARKVQILAPYSVTFEDGQYRVLLTGANNNVLDVANVNQVSIASQNSAGLIVAEGGEPGDVWDVILTGSQHNTPLSAGRRLREAQQALVIHEGTAQAGTPVTITLDASASAVDNFYEYDVVMIVGGTGVGQARIIRQYTGSTKVALISHRWAVTPDDTSEFSVKAGVTHAETDLALHSCYAQGGTANTITLATRASAVDQYYKYSAVILVGGTGAGQARIIDDYVGSTRVATIHGDWHTTPDNTTEYQIVDARTVVNVICQDCVDQISDGVWDELLADHTTPGSAAERLELLRKIATNRLELADGVGDNWVLYDDDDSPLLTWPVRDKSGGAIAQSIGVPSQRGKATSP